MEHVTYAFGRRDKTEVKRETPKFSPNYELIGFGTITAFLSVIDRYEDIHRIPQSIYTDRIVGGGCHYWHFGLHPVANYPKGPKEST